MKKWVIVLFISLVLHSLVSIGSVFAALEVIGFELEIELKGNDKYAIEYENRDGHIKAEYKVPSGETLYGADAKAMIEPLLAKLEVSPNMDKRELKEKVISIFSIRDRKVIKFDLDVKFSNGQRLNIAE